MPFCGGEDFVFFSPVFNFADACVSVSVVALFLFCRRELATLSTGTTSENPSDNSTHQNDKEQEDNDI
jgi:signal peptidase II